MRRNLAPRLLLAFGNDRSRDASTQDLLQYAGIAPVTERSGKKQWVHWRWGCPTFLRQTFVEWANESRKFSFWANAFYQAQKRVCKTHQAAIRALALNGFGFSIDVGKIKSLMMRQNTYWH
jgi:Transposase IS116/IS110/IS902 family